MMKSVVESALFSLNPRDEAAIASVMDALTVEARKAGLLAVAKARNASSQKLKVKAAEEVA